MKTIIAGSREGVTIEQVRAAIDNCLWEISEVVSGTAKGVDKFGEALAPEYGFPVKPFPAKWDDIEGKPPHLVKTNRFGKYYILAGHDRNKEMAEYADALILVHIGSSGSSNMLKVAKENNLQIYEVRV